MPMHNFIVKHFCELKNALTTLSGSLWMDGCKIRNNLSDYVNWLIGCSSALCHAPSPPIRPPLTGSSEVKGGPLHYSHRLHASSCLHSQHPTSHPSQPLQPLITDLSCHHTHIPLSHCRLIDEATFDNGIRNRGVCLVIRYYQTCLITAEEDPRQTDGFHSAQIWPQIMKLCDDVL